MSIKCDYNYKGVLVKDSYIKIERIFGSSKEGWNSLVSVNLKSTEEIDGEQVEKYENLGEFNFHTEYIEGETPYTTIYNKLQEELCGIKV